MLKLIQFEWKKIFQSKRNLAIIGVVFLILLVFFSSNVEADKEDQKESIKQAEFLSDWYKKESTSYTKSYKQNNFFICKLYSDIAEKRSIYFTEKARALREHDKEAERKADIGYYQVQLRYFVEGALYEGYTMEDTVIQNAIYSYRGIFGDMLGYEYRQEANFTELYGDYGKLPGMLIGYSDAVEETIQYYMEKLEFASRLETEHVDVLRVNEMKAVNFLYLTFKKVFPYLSLLLVLLIMADCMSTERDYGSYKFLLLQPISRGKILLSKAIAAITSAWVIILVPIFVCFLFIGVVCGFGSFQYPVIKNVETYTATSTIQTDLDYTRGVAYVGDFYSEMSNTTDRAYRLYEYRDGGLYMGISEYAASFDFSAFTTPNGNYLEREKTAIYNPDYYGLPERVQEMILHPFFTYVPMGDFLLQMLPGILLYLMFGALLGLCISTVTQHSLVSFVFCILIGGGGSILLSNIEGKAGRYLPFTFSNMVDCMQGFYNRTMLQGLMVIGTVNLVLLIICYVAFRKRDIVC